MITLAMKIEGRLFLVPCELYTVEGMDDQVIIKYDSGKAAVYPSDEVDEMAQNAHNILHGDQVKYVPNVV